MILARTGDGEIQVARYAERAWGVQLHPEVDETIVATWVTDSERVELAERGFDADRATAILNTASSIYFVNLVVMQWFNLFALRTRRLSVLQHSFNWYLLPAIVFALIIAIIFLYVPKFHTVLGTSVVPVEYWFLPMGFGMGLLLLDEGRKFVVRKYPKSFVAKIAW